MGVKAIYVYLLGIAILADKSFVFAQNSECPPEENINPCKCKNYAYGPHVQCENVKSCSSLQTAFKNFQTIHIGILVLHGIEGPIPNDLFVGMKVSNLQVVKSRVVFDGVAFRGLESSLGQLSITECLEVASATRFRLIRLDKLKELDFKKNCLDSIDDAWLKDSAPIARIVRLDSNEISSVGRNAFANLHNLEEISIADNRLKKIRRSMLPRPATKLTRIDFSHNTIQSLPSDMFEAMPNLHTVVFSGNELQTLPEHTWSCVLSSLDTLLLYENGINCDDRINWIKNRRTPRMFEGSCAAPQRLAGKFIKDVVSN